MKSRSISHLWNEALGRCKFTTKDFLTLDEIRSLIKVGFSGNMLQELNRLLRHKNINILKNVRQSVTAIKSHAYEISPEIEIGLEFFENAKYSSGEKGVPYWYVRNLENLVETMIKRKIEKQEFGFHHNQKSNYVSLMLSADHYAASWSLYISLLNVTAPNSPDNFSCIAHVSVQKDNWSIIKNILEKIKLQLNNIQDVKLTFEFPQSSSTLKKNFGSVPNEIALKDLQLSEAPDICNTHGRVLISTLRINESSRGRGPEFLIIHEPGELSISDLQRKERHDQVFHCSKCFRVFSDEIYFDCHTKINHPKKRTNLSSIHKDLSKYISRKTEKGKVKPLLKEISSLDAMFL